MSSLRKIGQLCLSNMKQTSRFGTSLMPISRNVQILRKVTCSKICKIKRNIQSTKVQNVFCSCVTVFR